MSVIINIVLILVSLVLIAAVLMQEGNKQGLGAIGGAAETFLGKNKSKSYEGKLLNITKIGAAVFVVLAILATWYNAKTFTVQYYVDGEEVFPAVDAQLELQAMMGYEVDASIYNDMTAEEKRATYSYGDTVIDYAPPAREGHVGKWDAELPETMDRKNYKLNAIYEYGTYTITFTEGVVPGADAAAEPVVIASAEYTYQDPIDASIVPALPAAPEGYEVAWDIEVPEVMPGYDVVINAVYTDPNAVEEEPAEVTEEPAEVETEEPAEVTEEPAEVETEEPAEATEETAEVTEETAETAEAADEAAEETAGAAE